jgi:hypothetical protein
MPEKPSTEWIGGNMISAFSFSVQLCIKLLFFAIVLLQLISHTYAVEFSVQQQLIRACYRVDVETVVKCLREGASVNAVFGQSSDPEPFLDVWTGAIPIDTSDWTPLMAVCNAPKYPEPTSRYVRLWENEALVKQLQSKYDPRTLEDREQAALTIVYILLSHKPELDKTDNHGGTALFMAVDNDKQHIVRTLLEFGANPNTKTRAYIDGPSDETPLHISRSPLVFQLLLEHKADPLAKDSTGRIPKPPAEDR